MNFIQQFKDINANTLQRPQNRVCFSNSYTKETKSGLKQLEKETLEYHIRSSAFPFKLLTNVSY